MKHSISNSDDVIDSRDIIERIDELESERDDLKTTIEEKLDELNELRSEGKDTEEAEEDHQAAVDELATWDEDEGQELEILKEVADQGESAAEDWRHGATLVRDSYFEEYAEELCKDIGDLPKNIPSYIEIDWAATASNIQVDYSSIDFDGETYWVR